MAKKRYWRLPKSLTSSRKRTVILTITLICLLIASIGALVAHSVTESLPSRANYPYQKVPLLNQAQRLIVGIDPTHQPLRFEQHGKITGYEAELMTIIGHQIGLAVEFKKIDQDAVFGPDALGQQSPLNSNQIHLYVASAINNRAKQQYYSLSQPYLTIGQVALSRGGQQFIGSTKDLDRHIITAIKYQAGHTLAQEYVKDTAILPVVDSQQLVKKLLNNQASVALVDLPTAQHLTQLHPDIQINSPVLDQGNLSIIASRQNYELINLINQTLSSLEQKGVLISLQKKWLESDD